RIQEGDRRGLARLPALQGPGRRLCARRQKGRGDVRLGGGPPPQSRAHGQMDGNPFIKCAAVIGGPAQGGAAGGMSETRKLVAILAADVVGYSRLMGEDEAGTARAVREHRDAARPIVASHSGRIVKTTGDGLLLEFPSVVAAVECATAIQKLMAERNAGTPDDKRIVYRIGVKPWRRVDRGRRHSRRWRQYRGAAGRHLRARRRADLG